MTLRGTRFALYARYSSDLQSKNSIEDQLRICRAHAAHQGWAAVHEFHDAGRPLNDIGMTGLVRRRNRDFIQQAVGPHTARKWLTDTARKRSPEGAFEGAKVLGQSPQTALKNYAQAKDSHAGKRHGEHIAKLVRQTAGLAECAFTEREMHLTTEQDRASPKFKPAARPASAS